MRAYDPKYISYIFITKKLFETSADSLEWLKT